MMCREVLGRKDETFHTPGSIQRYLQLPVSEEKMPLLRGMYSSQIERWLKYYSRPSLLAIDSAILYHSPEIVLRQVEL